MVFICLDSLVLSSLLGELRLRLHTTLDLLRQLLLVLVLDTVNIKPGVVFDILTTFFVFLYHLLDFLLLLKHFVVLFLLLKFVLLFHFLELLVLLEAELRDPLFKLGALIFLQL